MRRRRFIRYFMSFGALSAVRLPAVPQPLAASSDELVIFARFVPIAGHEDALATELRKTVARVKREPGCFSIEAYRSVRDTPAYFLHARWVNEPAFQRHADLPATKAFVERAQQLIDHPFDVTRTRLLA